MTTTLPERPLGLRVRDVREHRGLDYRQAAAEIGMSVGQLHRLENDGTLDPRISTARKVETWLEQHGPAPLAADRLPETSPVDVVEGEVWAWLNRWDSPWSPSDAVVSELAHAIARRLDRAAPVETGQLR